MNPTIKYLVVTLVVILSIIYVKLSLIKPPLEVAMTTFREDEKNIKDIEKHIRENYMYNEKYYGEPRIIFAKGKKPNHFKIVYIEDSVLIDFYTTNPKIKEVRLERGLCDENSKFSELIFYLEVEFAGNVTIVNDDCMKKEFESFKNNCVEIVRLEENWQISVENRW